MTLKEFTEWAKRHIEDFAQDWEENHEKTPNEYSTEMDFPEWYEQFHIFEPSDFECNDLD